MSDSRNTGSDPKMRNPVPYLIAVLILAAFALVYYLTPLFRHEPDEAAPVLTSEPTVIPVADDRPEQTRVTAEELESVLRPASDLITSKYYYTNAADFDSVLTWFGSDLKNPFTHSKGYVIYDGAVSVGIDVSEISFEIDNNRNVILIKLPEEKVLAHEIDNSSVKSDSSESIFNQLDAEYYAKLIGGFKEETEKKVMSNTEYIAQVRTNTEVVIRSLLTASHLTEDYTVEFAE